MLRLICLFAVLVLSACVQNPARVEMIPSGNGVNGGGVNRPMSPSANVRPAPRRPRSFSGEESLSAPQVALLNQAEKHLAMNKVNLAASKLERAIRINPHAVKPYRLLAELHLLQGNKRAAAEFARKGLAVIAKKGSPRNFRREKARLENILGKSQLRHS